MEEKKIAKMRRNNMKLYPIYKMIGLDWIFYYGVKILFLTQVKNISPADIILASSSIYSLFSVIFQIPSEILLEKIGKKNSIVLGQLLTAISMLIIIFCPNFLWLVVAQIIAAFGFDIRGIAESSFLQSSLPKTTRKGEIFSKIDGGGYSKFCYIGSISVLLSGFLYGLNPYIPLICCLTANLMAMIIAMNFIDIESLENKSKNTKKKTLKETMSENLKETKRDFQFVFKSKRLMALLMMNGFIWGLHILASSYQETALKELEIPSYYIGIILAAFQFLVGFFATKSIEFNDKFHNKSLTIIGLLVTIGSIIIGFVLIIPLPFTICLMIIVLVFIARAYSKGNYQVNKKRYMGNFANKQVLTKIYSVNGIYCNLSRMIIGFLGSELLRATNTAIASIVFGIVSTLIMLWLYIFAKKRLGLKPEEYSEKDICPEFVEK